MSMTSSRERRMELTLPMIPDIEIAAARAAGNLARELGMSSESIDEMAHAVIEATINAREHSCCLDQRIYLRFVGTPEADGGPRIELWITDHGRGFDPEKARTHRAATPAGPQKRGWGLAIMKAHMDEVEILTGPAGTTIRMVKTDKNRP
jgi:anti-sigma regulatory factor (Ser/Thr protein kinase)